MKKVVIVEVEYYSDKRLENIISLLESKGLELDKSYGVILVDGDTTITLSGATDEKNEFALRAVKDVVKISPSSDFVLFVKKSGNLA